MCNSKTTLYGICRHYFENHSNAHTVCANCIRILEEEKHRQLRMFFILWKKWNKLASSSTNQSVKSQKQCTHPRILLLWQKVYVKRHQHQVTVVLNNWIFKRQYWDEFCIKTLVWRHTKFNCFRSWSQLTIQCVFASLSASAIDLQKMPKSSSFQMKLILILAGT